MFLFCVVLLVLLETDLSMTLDIFLAFRTVCNDFVLGAVNTLQPSIGHRRQVTARALGGSGLCDRHLLCSVWTLYRLCIGCSASGCRVGC